MLHRLWHMTQAVDADDLLATARGHYHACRCGRAIRHHAAPCEAPVPYQCAFCRLPLDAAHWARYRRPPFTFRGLDLLAAVVRPLWWLRQRWP